MKRIKLLTAFLSLLFLIGVVNFSFASTPKETSLRRGERRQTVDPALFSDPEIKAAYKIAREIPAVLDSIYCFCQCEESPMFRHKSLLSCYVDSHAAQWGICMGEARRASELYKKGYPVKEIKKTVESEFSR